MPFRDVILPLVASKTLAQVFLLAMLMGVYSLLAIWKENSSVRDIAAIPSQVHAAMSLVLGCLLVFRTNTAYNRWWEARTLWGSLVNASRNLSIKLCQLTALPREDLQSARELITGFSVALKHHLRGENDSLLPSEVKLRAAGCKHIPQGIVNQLYQLVGTAKRTGVIDGDELRVLDAELLRLLDICGGCERILNTRIVASFRTFARQCVFLVLLTLPWGMAKDFGWWTIVLTIIISYFMIGLEIVAEHVEEPFGYDEDDLDLDAICKTIRSSVDEIFAQAR